MSFSRAFQWYHSHLDPNWPDGTFKGRGNGLYMGHFMVISMKIYPAEYSLSFPFLIQYIVNSLLNQLDFCVSMLYCMPTFLFISSFFCLCTGILVVLFCLFVSIFVTGSCFKSRSPTHSLFYPGYESSKRRVVQGSCRPRDVSYKGRIVQAQMFTISKWFPRSKQKLHFFCENEYIVHELYDDTVN